jgi:hypothetical protein
VSKFNFDLIDNFWIEVHYFIKYLDKYGYKIDKALSSSFESFYNRIKEILEAARNKVYRTANSEMVVAYWKLSQFLTRCIENYHGHITG